MDQQIDDLVAVGRNRQVRVVLKRVPRRFSRGELLASLENCRIPTLQISFLAAAVGQSVDALSLALQSEKVPAQHFILLQGFDRVSVQIHLLRWLSITHVRSQRMAKTRAATMKKNPLAVRTASSMPISRSGSSRQKILLYPSSAHALNVHKPAF